MDEDKRFWRATYDDAARRFDDDCRAGRWVSPRFYGMVLEHLGKLAEPKAGRSLHVLDVCCGTGAVAQQWAQAGHVVVAMDLSPGAVERIKRIPGRDDLPALVGDACRIPAPDAAFDVVLSIGMLQCLGALDDYFRELARVLRPGGRIILLFSPSSWLVRRRLARIRPTQPEFGRYRLHEEATACRALEGAGFGQFDVRHLFHFFYMPLLRPLVRVLNAFSRWTRPLAPLSTSVLAIARYTRDESE